MPIQLNTVGGQTVIPISVLTSITGAAYDQQITISVYGDNYRDDVWMRSYSPLVAIDNVARVSTTEITVTMTIAASSDPAHDIRLYAYNQWLNSAKIEVSAQEKEGVVFNIGAAGSAADATQVLQFSHGMHLAPTLGAVDLAADYVLIVDTDDSSKIKRTLASNVGGGGGGVVVTESAETGFSGIPYPWPANTTVFVSTATSGARYIELPAPSSAETASQYTVKDGAANAATHNITVTSAGGAVIDGQASATITANDGALTFVTEGTKWRII